MTRPPLYGDGATTETKTKFRDGRARNVAPDNDGVEWVDGWGSFVLSYSTASDPLGNPLTHQGC